jgi:hypothetical protein
MTSISSRRWSRDHGANDVEQGVHSRRAMNGHERAQKQNRDRQISSEPYGWPSPRERVEAAELADDRWEAETVRMRKHRVHPPR